MSPYLESTSLIPSAIIDDLVAEAQELEALIATPSDPWRLQVAAAGVRGNEAGGRHGFDDPMRAAVLGHHQNDPLSEEGMFFWYHSVTAADSEASLQHISALSVLKEFLRTESVRATLSERSGVVLAPASKLTLSLTRFGAGAFLAPHTDYVPGGTYALTVVLFLNRQWHPYFGGQLVVREKNAWRSIAPTAGRLVLFEPTRETEHYVQMVHPCAPTPRYAVSGWFHTTAETD